MLTESAILINGSPVERLNESDGLEKFFKKHGIKPEKGRAKKPAIGFSEDEQKWYGWSHRAIYGFKIGDVVKKGDLTAESGWIDGKAPNGRTNPYPLKVGFKAKTLEDAKKIAIAFASAVS